MTDRDAFLERVAHMVDRGEIQTPCLVMSRNIIERRAAEVGRRIPGSRVFFALKANDNIDAARVVAEAGLGFEVASVPELRKVLSLVPVDRVITSNPIKPPDFIRACVDAGVRMFAFDSIAEVDKMVALAPRAEAVIRLAVPNLGSEWPLSGKFGIEFGPAVDLLAYAKDKGLNVVGVNFHVGSQCTNLKSWDTAIGLAAKLFDEARILGMQLEVLNIGGGYPAQYLKPILTVEKIENAINKQLSEWFPQGVRIVIEPGRGLVGDAGVFVSRVIGKAERQDGMWVMIDVGVFTGLAETIGGIRYGVVTARLGEPQRFILAGPSCDGYDVIDREVEMVEPEVGDYVFLRTTGAYTTVYAAQFNGLPLPEVRLLDDRS
jgi:ornithine decarboxylase